MKETGLGQCARKQRAKEFTGFSLYLHAQRDFAIEQWVRGQGVWEGTAAPPPPSPLSPWSNYATICHPKPTQNRLKSSENIFHETL